MKNRNNDVAKGKSPFPGVFSCKHSFKKTISLNKHLKVLI